MVPVVSCIAAIAVSEAEMILDLNLLHCHNLLDLSKLCDKKSEESAVKNSNMESCMFSFDFFLAIYSYSVLYLDKRINGVRFRQFKPRGPQIVVYVFIVLTCISHLPKFDSFHVCSHYIHITALFVIFFPLEYLVISTY